MMIDDDDSLCYPVLNGITKIKCVSFFKQIRYAFVYVVVIFNDKITFLIINQSLL